MITEDIEISKHIFDILNSGIAPGYDSFEFTVTLQVGYMEWVILVTKDGLQTSNTETSFNAAVLSSWIEKLRDSFLARGSSWKAFSMTYVNGGEVKTKFQY